MRWRAELLGVFSHSQSPLGTRLRAPSLLRAGLAAGYLMGAVACSTGDEGFDTGLDPEDTNVRPSVSLLPGSGNTGDITVEFSVTDPDEDPINVTVYFSTDGGEIFKRCSPASASENPVTSLATGSTGAFVWDSSTDLPGDYDVNLRLVPNDDVQDGPAVVSDTFAVSNTPIPGSGEGGEESDLGEVGGYDDVTVDGDGEAEISLNDGSDATRDNKSEEFLLIVGNVGASAAGFSLAPADSGARSQANRSQATRAHAPAARVEEISPYRTRVRQWAALNHQIAPEVQAKTVQAGGVVGVTVQEFRVRADMDDSGEYANVIATLAAEGDAVQIWVDRDVPIDWDYDCTDSVIDEPDRAGRETYGFDTCDLSSVANIFDKNILYHLHQYFGDESDVDGNSALNVLITPVLNQLTITNTSEEDDTTLVEVYADPEVDLAKFDASENPGSNYQEIIYLSAPDPAGFYNPLTGGGGDEAVAAYVTVTMGANIAIETSKLIGYNLHVVQGDGDPEEDWLSDGLGLLAADLTGFGSVVYDDVAYYLDAPHLATLTEENSLEDVNDRGMQYLLCRYLVDAYGVAALEILLSSPYVGVDNIEALLQETDPEATFDGFFLEFLTAIATNGLLNNDTGTDLVADIPLFKAATTIAINSTEYFGAEGYQQGINVRGVNYARSRNQDGTFATKEIRLNGADGANFAPGITYYGSMAGGYGAMFVRVGGLIDAATTLKLSANSEEVVGRIVRLNNIDPSRPTMVIEQVFGALATDLIPLELFEDGGESVGLGEIDDAQKMVLLSGESQSVEDTDLYHIDLSGFSVPMVDVVFSVDRSMVDVTGSVDLEDVLLAVVPLGDLPNPSNIKGRYTCDGTVYSVSYPSAFVEYLYSQYVLVPTSGTESGYNPAGRVSDDPTTCNFDLSGEKSLNSYLQNDDDEPNPATLVDQIWTFQVQSLNGRSTVSGFYPYDEGFLDSESTDTDDEVYYDLAAGLGGRFTDSGEEALLHVQLPSGEAEHQYVLVVGGVESTGPYELTARVLPAP